MFRVVFQLGFWRGLRRMAVIGAWVLGGGGLIAAAFVGSFFLAMSMEILFENPDTLYWLWGLVPLLLLLLHARSRRARAAARLLDAPMRKRLLPASGGLRPLLPKLLLLKLQARFRRF